MFGADCDAACCQVERAQRARRPLERANRATKPEAVVHVGMHVWVWALWGDSTAKCAETLCTTDGYHLVIWHLPVLCYIFDVSGSGHPQNFTAVGTPLYEACWHQHGRDPKWQPVLCSHSKPLQYTGCLKCLLPTSGLP